MAEADKYEVLEKIGKYSCTRTTNTSNHIKGMVHLESSERCAGSQMAKSSAGKRSTTCACHQKKESNFMRNLLSSRLSGTQISSDTSTENT